MERPDFKGKKFSVYADHTNEDEVYGVFNMDMIAKQHVAEWDGVIAPDEETAIKKAIELNELNDAIGIKQDAWKDSLNISNQPHEIAYAAEKMNVTPFVIHMAKHFTKSSDRELIYEWIKEHESADLKWKFSYLPK